MSKKVNCGTCNGVGLDINLDKYNGRFFCHNQCIEGYKNNIEHLERQLAEAREMVKKLLALIDSLSPRVYSYMDRESYDMFIELKKQITQENEG